LAGETPDRYAQAASLFAMLAPELESEGFELVDVRIFRGGGRLQVRLSVDLPGDARIDLDGCARASRAASMFLEEADPFGGAWVLEVSSPGIRRPLRTEAHFAAVEGRDVTVKYRSPDASRPVNLRGRLEQVADGTLTIAPAAAQDAAQDEVPEPVTIAVDQVLEANLDHDFDVQEVIREDRRRRKDERRQKRQSRRKRKGSAAEDSAADDPETEPDEAGPHDQERDGT
jgi:ribosome maturation factor RimP